MLLKYVTTRDQVQKFLKTIEDRTRKNQNSLRKQLHEPRL